MADEDIRGFEVAQRLLDCVYDRLLQTEAGTPDRACVISGGLAWDNCECGQLTVAIERSYGSSKFPTPAANTSDQYSSGRCGQPLLVWVYNVTMLRCVPSGGETGEPPDCSDLALSARISAIDAAAVRAGVECCLQAMFREKDESGVRTIVDFYTGDQTMVGPEGTCGGSSMNVVIALLSRCPCE